MRVATALLAFVVTAPLLGGCVAETTTASPYPFPPVPAAPAETVPLPPVLRDAADLAAGPLGLERLRLRLAARPLRGTGRARCPLAGRLLAVRQWRLQLGSRALDVSRAV